MNEPRPLDAARTADQVVALVSAPLLAGGLGLRLLRLALRWTLRRAARGADAATGRWLDPATEARLAVESLRPLAWTMVLEDDAVVDPASRAASLAVASLRFRDELRESDCPARLRSACERLFGTTLVPGEARFEVHRGKGRHVLVGCAAGTFAVDVLGKDGTVRSEGAIRADLASCLREKDAPAKAPLAVTAMPRELALAAWQRLRHANPGGTRGVEEALFSVLFDPASPADPEACGRLAQAGDPTNRCFWHALQLVVFDNGKAAVVGSFVGGVEAEGGLALGGRIGRAKAEPREGNAPIHPAPPARVTWHVPPRAVTLLESAPAGGSVDVGGRVVVDGYGAKVWAELGTRAETAVVVALRMALDAVVPELDELECMVNLSHLRPGLIARVGSTSAEMRALLEAARTAKDDLSATASTAIAAHRARIRLAKRGDVAEASLDVASYFLTGASAVGRFVTGLVLRLLAWQLALRTPSDERAGLGRLSLAVDSSVPLPEGVASFGRFGLPGPPRGVWVHHSVAEGSVAFVLQLGADLVPRAAALRKALPVALSRLRASAREERPQELDPPRVPTSRLAYRRIMGLLGAIAR